MPRALSYSTRPSTSIRPDCGRSSPAMALSTEVLPAPDGPTRATMRASSSIRTWRAKPPRRRWTSRLSTQMPPLRNSWLILRPTLAAHQPFGGEQGEQGDGDRHRGQAPDRRFAARHLHQAIDGRGKGPGFTRDRGYEGDGGAELAKGLGKAEHGAGHQPRPRQRQGDGEEPPPRRSAERG